jgi:predicted murein hydrolase (TIGR00659 family)
MNFAVDTPIFGVTISIVVYFFAVFISKKIRLPILNPLLLSIAIIIFILNIFRIDYQTYSIGGSIITFFLAPATIVLAVPLYKEWNVLKSNFFVIIIGVLVGVLSGIISTYFLGKFFNLDLNLIESLLPKNTTTPIAIEIANMLNAKASLTVTFVILSGTLGYVIGEYILKVFHINDKVARGISLGTASHVMGTTKAMEFGEVEGAMASLAISLAGILTILILPFILNILRF